VNVMRGRSFVVGVVLAGLLTIMLPSVPAWAVGGGTLDPMFGTGGRVLTDFGGQDMAYGMAVQADGKVVAAGFANVGGHYDFALARYNRDGTLDATFGTGGKVLTDFSGAGSFDEARAVAIQPDGKVVAAGGSTAGGNDVFALARYNFDGTLDATFGAGGKVLTGVAGDAYAVAVQPGGKIVAAGSSSTDFALVQYNHDGTVDATFGAGGKVLTDFGGNDYAYALAVRPVGKIVAAGFSDARGSYDFGLARYNRDGTLDATFGGGGRVLTDVSGAGSYDVALAVAVQPDGKIVTAGASGAVRNADFVLARYNRDGTLDATFGTSGKVVTDVSGTGSDNEAFAVAVQPDRKIVAAGVSGTIRSDFALARYQP
jgi:uncharacterized delta-60 repeat protein